MRKWRTSLISDGSLIETMLPKDGLSRYSLLVTPDRKVNRFLLYLCHIGLVVVSSEFDRIKISMSPLIAFMICPT